MEENPQNRNHDSGQKRQPKGEKSSSSADLGRLCEGRGMGGSVELRVKHSETRGDNMTFQDA